MTILPQGDESLEAAAAEINGGGLIVFPTDTFYGLGADPFNADAVERVKVLKGREGHKPILVVLSDVAQGARFAESPGLAFHLLSHAFWPGPLTLVVGARSIVPQGLTAGTRTVGLRVPDDEGVRELVRACGRALTATSANDAGRPPARSVAEAADYFGEGVALYVDGGWSRSEKPSTVVDVSRDGEVVIVRGGAVPREAIEAVLSASNLKLSAGA